MPKKQAPRVPQSARRRSDPEQPARAEVTLPGRPLPYQIGHRIAYARKAKGWTQGELAERLGKSRGTIVQYEQGNIEPPLTQVQRLADALEVAPEFLAFGARGISGLDELKARVAAIAEVNYRDGEAEVSGAYGLPERLVEQHQIDLTAAKVIEVEHAAPEFRLKPGDRVLVEETEGLEEEDRLYVLRTHRGPDVVRLLPNLSSQRDLVKINDGSGQTHSYERKELKVIGRVVALLRFV